jgi:hypothetical protein
MKTITIGFSKSKKRFAIGSWAIRAFQGTKYSHVYIKFKSDSLQRVLIYEAVGAGLRFIGTKVWESHAEEVVSFSIDIDQENYLTLMRYCVDNAGTEYGFTQNIGIAICELLRLKNNPFKKGKNCSEVVGEMLKLEGFSFVKETNLLTPKDIYEVLDGKNKN